MKPTLVVALVSSLLGAPGCASGDREPPPPITAGQIETWAGDGVQGYDFDGHDRRESRFSQPMEIVFAADGSALIVDWNNHVVRRVGTDGVLERVVGTDLPGDWPCQVPGDPAGCEVPLSGTVAGVDLGLNHPLDVALRDDGGFFLAAWHNHKIESCDAASGDVTIVAGLQKPGGDGDNGPASAARLSFPSSIVLDPDGGLVVSDEKNNRVRRIAPTAIISTVAGAAAGAGVADDGVPAVTAALALTTSDEAAGSDNPPPGGAIALGADGSLFVADTFHHCVRRIDPGSNGVLDGVDGPEELITTVVGTCGSAGYAGDGGPATQALLNRPFDVEIGPDGALYVADTENHVVRRIDLATSVITTFAGSGAPGFSGDRGPAVEARLRAPYGLAFDAKGDLFIVDTLNNRIRRVAGS